MATPQPVTRMYALACGDEKRLTKSGPKLCSRPENYGAGTLRSNCQSSTSNPQIHRLATRIVSRPPTPLAKPAYRGKQSQCHSKQCDHLVFPGAGFVHGNLD